jgi:integrase
MTDVTPHHKGLITASTSADFAALVNVTLRTLESSASQRVYRQTFNAWESWANQNGISPLDLNAANVAQFLIDQPVTKATRQRMLSALRKLSEMLTIVDYQNPVRQAAHKTLTMLKTPSENAADNERPKRALNPGEAYRVLEVWNGDSKAEKRNRALIAVLMLTGMRRSEAAVLKWSDIDLTEGVIYIRHGKGDKAREVAIYGDVALDALTQWQHTQGTGRQYVFCSVNKGNHLGPDKPMTPTSVYRVVKATERSANLKHFSPHDARRTLITELLATGTPLADAQAQAGHSQGQTTLRYAQAIDARQRRRSGRLRYG